MGTRQQMFDDAAVAGESPFAVRGNTRTVALWHLNKSVPEREAEVQRQTTLRNEADAKERATLEERRARYNFSSAEREHSEREWRNFLASRSREGAAEDFVSPWRDSVSAPKPEKSEVVGEARFSKMVVAQHDDCALYEAFDTVWADATLSKEEKERYARGLVHRDPKRLISLPTGRSIAPGARDESSFDDLVGASAWGHDLPSSARKNSAVSKENVLGNMFDTADIMASTLDVRKGGYKLYQSITKFLVRGAGLLSDNEVVDNLTNNKALRQHSEAVLQRLAVYRANKGAAHSALVAANWNKRLSVDDIERASKAKADVLELERDLAMLEIRQKANKACIELSKTGYTVLRHSNAFCEIRRLQRATGYYHRQRGGHGKCEYHGVWNADDDDDNEMDDGAEVGADSFPKERAFKRTEKMRREYPLGRDLPSKGSQPPLTLNESPQALTGGPSLYFQTMREFSKRTREQEDNVSTSSDDGPFNLKQSVEAASGGVGAAGPSTEVAATPSSKSGEEKDSKVKGLLEGDGITSKDFARAPEQKKGKGLRKLSVSAGSPSRPRWR